MKYSTLQLLFDDGLGVVGDDCGDVRVRVRVNEFYLNLKSNTDVFYVEFTEFIYRYLTCQSRVPRARVVNPTLGIRNIINIY